MQILVVVWRDRTTYKVGVYTEILQTEKAILWYRPCGGSRGGSGGSVEPPFGSLISMKNTDLNVYFCSKVPFREFTNPPSNPPSQNPGSAPETCHGTAALLKFDQTYK